MYKQTIKYDRVMLVKKDLRQEIAAKLQIEIESSWPRGRQSAELQTAIRRKMSILILIPFQSMVEVMVEVEADSLQYTTTM